MPDISDTYGVTLMVLGGSKGYDGILFMYRCPTLMTFEPPPQIHKVVEWDFIGGSITIREAGF